MGNKLAIDVDEFQIRIGIQDEKLKKIIDIICQNLQSSEIIQYELDRDLILNNKKNPENTNKENKIYLFQFESNQLDYILEDDLIKNYIEQLEDEQYDLYMTGYQTENFIEKITKTIQQQRQGLQLKEIRSKHIMNCKIGIEMMINNKQLYSFKNQIDNTMFNKLNKEVHADKYLIENKIEYPYILVNIKSGISIYKITGENVQEYEKLGGSFIGENTLENIIKMSTEYKSIEEAIKEGINGDHTQLDMTVGDIYGEKMKLLPKDIIAASLGKVKSHLCNNFKFQQKDLVKSLICAFAINVSQLSVLYTQIANANQIVFISFAIDHLDFNFLLKSMVNYFSQDGIQSYFIHQSKFLPLFANLIQDHSIL